MHQAMATLLAYFKMRPDPWAKRTQLPNLMVVNVGLAKSGADVPFCREVLFIYICAL